MKFAIKVHLITTMLLTLELCRLCVGCDMPQMRNKALKACDDFARNIRHISSEDPTLEYRIISVAANRTDRSVGHHRKLAKIITKDDFPENGYLVVYHPYTNYFNSSKHRFNKNSSKEKSHKHHHYKHRHNEILKENVSDDNIRPKRNNNPDPYVSYCCAHPKDIEVCNELTCFHFK